MAGIPNWLQSISSAGNSYFNCAFPILANRERAREIARHVSRNQNIPESKSSSFLQRIANPIPILSNHAKKLDCGDYYSVSVGCQLDNKNANRYLEIEPYNRTRVIVRDQQRAIGGNNSVKEDASSGRYLNANWVRELNGGKWWIASQAPLPNTVHAFLSIILQPDAHPPATLRAEDPGTTINTRVRTVVQLTRLQEGGRRKAHAYFPTQIGQSQLIPPEEGRPDLHPIKITLQKVEEVEEARCVMSTLSLSVAVQGSAEEPVTFKHLLYTAWPDHGVPEEEDRASLLSFVRLVDRVNKDVSTLSRPSSDGPLNPDPPMIVGCSAGIGRTGSFIALSSLYRKYGLFASSSSPSETNGQVDTLPVSPLGLLPSEIRDDLILLEVDSLREQRCGMVQRDEQIILVYVGLIQGLVNSARR